MPTAPIKHQTDKGKTVEGIHGYKGNSFQAFSRAETVPFYVNLKDATGQNTNFSTYQIFVSFTDINVDSCGVMTAQQFAEARLDYLGTDPDDPAKYPFSGAITDEQTILLPEGIGAVIGAIKVIDPAGGATFVDKAKVTVFPCSNPRLDQD